MILFITGFISAIILEIVLVIIFWKILKKYEVPQDIQSESELYEWRKKSQWGVSGN